MLNEARLEEIISSCERSGDWGALKQRLFSKHNFRPIPHGFHISASGRFSQLQIAWVRLGLRLPQPTQVLQHLMHPRPQQICER